MIITKEHLDFDDLNILCEPSTEINSRNECNVYREDNMLPLFTAPMDTVINESNADLFLANGIHPMLPRNSHIAFLCPHSGLKYDTNKWIAVGLEGFESIMSLSPVILSDKINICIDIANGHMVKLVDLIYKAKKKYGSKMQIMAGNVAHPDAYIILSNAGADYVRVGIGNGAGCLTTLNTGIGYPMATLIDEVNKESSCLTNPAKIVADGGMQGFADINKALALGADYVMIGSLFNKALESAGTTYREVINRPKVGIDSGERERGEEVDQYSEAIKIAFNSGARFYKKFRGMSTKDVQKELGNTTIRTSEGISRTRLVEYTLEGWVENFKHYLSTAMSYTNAATLDEFIGYANLIRVSQNSYKRVNK